MAEPEFTYTEQEHELIRRAALGGLALVSQAEPGFFDSFKEAMAGSKALTAAPAGLRELFTGGFVMPPKASSREERTTLMLDDVRDALQVIQAKSPEEAEGFRAVLLAAAEKVAGAADGVSPAEQEMIGQLKTQLTEEGAAAPGGPSQANPVQEQPIDNPPVDPPA